MKDPQMKKTLSKIISAEKSKSIHQILTKEQILAVIQKVAKNHRKKAFGIWGPNDIEHEVYIIAQKILPDFNTKFIKKNKSAEQALENWLNSSISKRLINFHRDKFVGNPKKFKSARGLKLHQRKFNLSYPLDLTEVAEDNLVNFFDTFDDFEAKDRFLAGLNEAEIDIVESYLSGEKLSSYYKNIFIRIIVRFATNDE